MVKRLSIGFSTASSPWLKSAPLPSRLGNVLKLLSHERERVVFSLFHHGLLGLLSYFFYAASQAFNFRQLPPRGIKIPSLRAKVDVALDMLDGAGIIFFLGLNEPQNVTNSRNPVFLIQLLSRQG